MFVESVLRYGLPVNFQAMLLQVGKVYFSSRMQSIMSNCSLDI